LVPATVAPWYSVAEEEIMSDIRLPDQFRDLEPLAHIWDLPTEVERHAKRLASSITELRALYDALMPGINDVLSYLSEFQLEDLTPEGRNLFNPACSLAEIAPAVELFGQPEVPAGYDSRRFIPAKGSRLFVIDRSHAVSIHTWKWSVPAFPSME
jgi:hypothetical protein